MSHISSLPTLPWNDSSSWTDFTFLLTPAIRPGHFLPSRLYFFQVAEPLHLLLAWLQKETSTKPWSVCPARPGLLKQRQGMVSGSRELGASGENRSPTIFLCLLTRSFAQPGCSSLCLRVAGHTPEGWSPGARPRSFDTGVWIPGEKEKILGRG